MEDARYFRQQADVCLKIAKQLSDRAAADKLRESSAHYLAQAMRLEAELSRAVEDKPSQTDKPLPADKSQFEPK